MIEFLGWAFVAAGFYMQLPETQQAFHQPLWLGAVVMAVIRSLRAINFSPKWQYEILGYTLFGVAFMFTFATRASLHNAYWHGFGAFQRKPWAR